MININLLPWRVEHQKRQKKHRLIAILVSAGVSVMMWIFLSFVMNVYLAHLAKIEIFLEKQLDHAKEMSASARMLKQRYEALLKIEAAWAIFQAKQQQGIARFSEMVKLSGAPVRFKEMNVSQKEMALTGEADAMQDLEQLVNLLHRSFFYKSLQLKTLTHSLEDGVIHFALMKQAEVSIDHPIF